MKRPLVLIVLLFVAVCIAYNLAVPLFEGTDEGAHFLYVDYLASNGHLPDMNHPEDVMRPVGAIIAEIHQTPLYYIVTAFLVHGIDRSDYSHVFRINKDLGVILHDHTNAEFAFPPYGTTLAVRIARLFSTLLGVAFIMLVYASTLRLLGDANIGILAAGITAFNPKFVHMCSIVTNDIAVATAGALVLFILACLWRSAHDTQPQSRRTQRWLLFSLGAATGLAFLCKSNGLALGLPAFVTVVWLAWRTADKRLATLILNGALCLGGFLLSAGWYMLYNTVIYGNPLAWDQIQIGISFMARSTPLTLADLPMVLNSLIASYWGTFGHGVRWNSVFDLVPLLFVTGTVLGLGLRIARRRKMAGLVLCAIVGTGSVIAFIPWLLSYTAGEGSTRLMAPAFAAFQVLITAGLVEWFPERMKLRASYVLPFLALVVAVAVVPLLLIPAYNVPHYLSLAEERALPAGGRVLFDNGIALESVTISDTRYNPGEVLTITAYWRATKLIDRMYLLAIDMRDADGQSLGRVDATPMQNRLNTSQWGSGVLRDEYQMRIPQTQRQTIAHILLGWYPYDNRDAVVRIAGSSAVSAQVAEIKLRGNRPTDVVPSHPLSVTFGADIALEGYDIDGDRIRLYWRCRGVLNYDYTAFVHALDTADRLIGQSDHQPSYSSRFWEVGEQIVDEHEIPGLATANQIQIGLYDPATGTRLPAQKLDRTSWTDNIVIIMR